MKYAFVPDYRIAGFQDFISKYDRYLELPEKNTPQEEYPALRCVEFAARTSNPDPLLSVAIENTYLLSFHKNGIPKGQCPFGGFGRSPLSIIAQRYFIQRLADRK